MEIVLVAVAVMLFPFAVVAALLRLAARRARARRGHFAPDRADRGDPSRSRPRRLAVGHPARRPLARERRRAVRPSRARGDGAGGRAARVPRALRAGADAAGKGRLVSLNEYALEHLVKERLARLRADGVTQQLAARAAQGYARRAITASIWHFLKPYAV